MKQFGFSAFEKLKSRNEIKKVISDGVTLFSADKKIKAIYLVKESEGNSSVKVAPAVYKKLGCAVWRNRLKRLIRESYRLNKKDLLKKSTKNHKEINIIFSPHHINEQEKKHVKLNDILPGMLDVLKKITERI